MEKEIRLNKYLADKNYASRRGADELIASGKVFINGEKAELGTKVKETDEVTVEGYESKPHEYYAYYKPKGIVTFGAQNDEKEIKNISNLPKDIFPMGRLDKDSEGLIIMTNDGRITEALLSPYAEHEKEYRVTIDKPVVHQFLIRMNQGVNIGKVGAIKNYKTKPAKIRKVSSKSFDIILTEGKNRQIRKMAGALGSKVTGLKRFRIMNISLGQLKPNTFRKIKDVELKNFLRELI